MIERLESSAFLPRKDLYYYDAQKLFPIFERLAFRANTALQGPKGIAKSLAVAAFAGKIDCPIVTYDCSEDVRRSNLVGMHTLRGGETPFVLGPLTTAFEVANELGRCILCLEEFSSLQPAQQRLLNPITDWRRRVEVPECQKVFSLNDQAKLWVVLTQNTTAYAGTYAMNEDLKSRFRILQLEYPDQETELKTLEGISRTLKLETEKEVLTGLVTLARETRAPGARIEYPLGTRDLVQVMEDTVLFGIEGALTLLLGKFEGPDRTTVATRVQSIFG